MSFSYSGYRIHVRAVNSGDMEDVVCDDIDVLIHTQKVCPAPLQQCNKTAHVLDLQDNPRPSSRQNLATMDAEIFVSKAATEEYCVTKFCLRLSESFDLSMCDNIVNEERKVMASSSRLIGLVGNAKEYGTVAEALHRANISFIRESAGKADNFKTCHFYSQITLAIAWSPFIVTNASLQTEYGAEMVNRKGDRDQAKIDYWHNQKPAERFTNPQWFDIPTIGYANYSSFQAYGTEFLLNIM